MHAGDVARERYNQRRYREALDACRASLTWYLLCHQAHTVPFLRTGAIEAKQLLEIDVGALASILDTLYGCYRKNALSNDFPSVLTHLREAIDHPQWGVKIVYFRALWAAADREDPAQARLELEQLDLDKVVDVEILTLYVDVCDEELGFAERLRLYDRILDLTTDPSHQLQYAAAKGVTVCLIGEMRKGCERLRDAVGQYRSLDVERRSQYGDFVLARVLIVLAELSGDKQVASEALSEYRRLRDAAQPEEFLPSYFAELDKSLGDCHTFLGQYADAIQCDQESLRIEDSELTKVFLARAYANSGSLSTARTLLDQITTSELRAPQLYDYAMSWAVLATVSLERPDIDLARDKLKAVKASALLFRQQRDAVVISLLEAKAREVGTIRRTLSMLNRYVSLNPNLFGLGINLNKIVEDLESRARKPPPTAS